MSTTEEDSGAVPRPSKPWWTSKQIWLGLGAAVIEGGQFLLDAKVVPAGAVGAVIGVLSILVRRFGENEPIHFVTPRSKE